MYIKVFKLSKKNESLFWHNIWIYSINNKLKKYIMKTINTKSTNEVVRQRTKTFLFVFVLFFALQSNAQLSISININSNTSRVYETEHRHVHNTRCHHEEIVDYYYYPEIEVYFDLQSSVFIYYGSNGWVRTKYLPRYYNDYDVQRGYRVELDYHGQRPYTYFHDHKMKYKIKKHKYNKGKHKGHKKH